MTMRRVLISAAVVCTLGLAGGTDAFAQKAANPCAAKNPCAVKGANPCAAKNPCDVKK